MFNKKNIIIPILAIFITSQIAMADDVYPILTARHKNNTNQQTQEKIEDSVTPINMDASEIVIPEEELSPVFKPYQPSKGEVVFSYTKNWINAIDPTAATNKVGGYLPGA